MTVSASDLMPTFPSLQATLLANNYDSLLEPIVVSPSQQAYGGAVYATYSSATCKTKQVASVDCQGLVLTFNSLLVGTVAGTPEVLPANDFEIKVSIELSSGTLIPVWFGTNRLIRLKPGVAVESNVVGVDLAANETFYVRTFVNRIISNTFVDNIGEAGTITSNLTNLISGYSARGLVFNNGEGAVFSAATGVDPFLQDFTDSGSVAASNNVVFGPVTISAIPKTNTLRSVTLIGDSILNGTGDIAPPSGSIVNTNYNEYPYGYGTRALGPAKIGFTRLTIGGEQVQEWLLNTKTFYRQALINSPVALVALGTNDIATGGRTALQIQADLTSLVTKLKKYFQTIYVATITPRSTSTDGWTTLANQIPSTGNDFTNIKNTVNTWLRNGGLVGATVLDIAKIVESSLNSGKWIAGTILASGTATGGTGTTLIDAGATWTVNQWYGYVTTNLATGQSGVITSNTATTLTINGTFSPVPGAGNAYSISASYTADNVHPSSYGHQQIASALSLGAFGG